MWLFSILMTNLVSANFPRKIVPSYVLTIDDSSETVGGGPLGKPLEVKFSVADKTSHFENEDRVEIWEINEAKKKIRLLGVAKDPEVLPSMTTGAIIPRTLKMTFHPKREETIWCKAFIRISFSRRIYESNPIELVFYDDEKLKKELSRKMQKADDLQKQIPKRTFTSSECQQEGGTIETGGAIIGIGKEIPSSLCKKGTPIGHVTGMKCQCICCK